MRNLSLAPLTGISGRLFASWMNLRDMNTVNDLIEKGFVQAKEGALSIKPDISRLTLLTSGWQERFTFRQGIEIMMKKEKENKNL